MASGVVLTVNRMVAAALEPRLERRGMLVLDGADTAPGLPYVEVVQCSGGGTDGWTAIKRGDDLNRVGFVALISTPDLEAYRRAYHLGAAVVIEDSDPDAAADIIEARAAGEIRVPAGLLTALLGENRRSLTERERLVFGHLLDGRTMAEVSESTHYSERHVRRIVSTVLAKAGTRSRVEAAEFFSDDLEGRTGP